MPMTRLVAGVASMSWIDPKTGLPEVDKGGDPGPRVTREEIKAGRLYRFSNLLEAFVDVDERGVVVKAGFTDASRMYRGPSAFGLDSAVVGKIGRSVKTARSSATFRQLVGCRTVSPEKAGNIGGAVVGGGVGVWAGAKVGAGLGSFGGPVGMFVGAVALGTVGYLAGREVAELVMAFPPIWTELELTIFADRSLHHTLVAHSVFPSNTLYAHATARTAVHDTDRFEKDGTSYDGDDVRLARWKTKGWGPAASARSGATDGNPWGMSDPGKRIGAGTLVHECVPGYVCT